MAGLSEAYSVLETAYAIYIACQDRLQKSARNPQLACELAALFKLLLDELAPLADKFNNNAYRLPDHDRDFFNRRVEQLCQNLTATCEELKKKTKKLRNRAYRFFRAISTSDFLSQLEVSARRADELLRDIAQVSLNATLISRHAEEVTSAVERHAEGLTEEMKKRTEEMTVAIGNLTAELASASEPGNDSAADADVFRHSFDVPDNPPHVVLKFGSLSEAEQDTPRTCTIEAKLKAVVLRSDGSQCIGAVGFVGHAVGTEGMSGVGKSCALRGLAKDPEVRQRFRDGIYYVILGKDATEANVVQQIANVVEASGGTRKAREILGEENARAAVRKARQWFAGKCSLLLLDDAWEKNESGRDVVACLSRVVDTEKGSRVVFTTRDVRVGLLSERIHFSARGEEVSLQIFLASARLREEDIEEFRSTIVQAVLDLCGGLPMALAIAGSAIKVRLALQSRTGSTAASTTAELLREYLSDLKAHPNYLLYRTVDNDPYGNLSSAFAASLSMLDKNVTEILPFQPLMPFSEMYRALIVLQQRQGWLPVTALELLWDTEDEHQAMNVLVGFASANIAQREDRWVNGKKTPGISLHDLHLRFVQDECKKASECEKWHRKLLSKYLPETNRSSSQTAIASRNWCKDEVFADDYIRNNVSRHLLGAGLRSELHELLRNPKWAAKRLCGHEMFQLAQDFGVMFERLRREGGLDLRAGSDEWALTMIEEAARLSSPYVSGNPTEVWFQLYARLVQLSEQSDIIRMYLVDIERCAERPWVKRVRALSACVPGSDGALQSTVVCDGEVTWISKVGNGGEVVACGRKGDYEVFVSTVTGGQVQKTVWLSMMYCSSSATSDDGLSARFAALGAVSAVCCTIDGSRIVTGHRNGAVQVWNAETEEPVGDAVRRHHAPVRCVAFSADGKRVASGSDDKMVCLWDAETGEPLSDNVFSHSDWVRCVAFSADGHLVASGSDDETVRVWDVETGEPVSGALCGHTSPVLCVAFSADGKFVASGSDDETVRVWDAETGEQVGDALHGHSGWVMSVALSADGKRVASGSVDKTVRVWDVVTGEPLGDPLYGHNGSVWCVVLSADGNCVASGSVDKTVRVWNSESGVSLSDILHGSSAGVKCVVLSSYGKRIAWGSLDKKAQVMDAVTGKWLRAEDDWTFGDVERLRFLLREECIAPGEHGIESRVGLHGDSAYVWYCSSGNNSILATLDGDADWELSSRNMGMLSLSGNDCVDFLELVV